MSRPRLLFLSQILPYPPDSGVAIRTYHVMRLLSGTYDVVCLGFYRRRARPTAHDVEKSVAALSEFARVDAFPIDQEYSRLRFTWDHLRSVCTGRSYTRFVYESSAFRRRLLELLENEHFDLVHVDSLDLVGYLPLLHGRRVVCVHHNVESQLLRRRAAGERSRAKRAYFGLQAKLTEREERTWCPRVTLNVAVSEADRQDLRRLAPVADCIVVPNGVDTEEFRPQRGAGKSIVFLGGTEWFPNVDALDFFCDEILPRIREAGEDPPVYWVGRCTDAEREHYRERAGVELTGYVEDIRPFVHDAACTVVPLRIGGGTRLKITTAWALGKAVVSTSIGCEGLAAVDGENLLVRDDPAAFADAVLAVLRDESLRTRLGAGARESAESTYSWDVIGSGMREAYTALVGNRPGAHHHTGLAVLSKNG